MQKLNFEIAAAGIISRKFIENGITTLGEALDFVKKIPYGRNSNKSNLLLVFSEKCGTCSTKHALLKILAQENNFSDIKLMLGIYKMTVQNTTGIGDILNQSNLKYIPEAHNYLKIGDQIIDCTFPNSASQNFLSDLLFEVEINVDQIDEYKIKFHKSFLGNWLTENISIELSLSELWAIREKCIFSLSQNN